MRVPLFLSLASLLLIGGSLAGCGSDDTTSANGSKVAADAEATDGQAVDGQAGDTTSDGAANAADAGVADAGPQKQALVWAECTVTYSKITPQCTKMVLPMDWSKPNGTGLPVHVARVLATKPRRGSLWLLQGGPGGDGTGLAPIAALFAKALPDLDIYLPDHRGTGLSGRLGCAKQEAKNSPGGDQIASFEWSGCIKSILDEWGDSLAQLTPSNASRDLNALINATKKDGDKVFIYGVSYGTYWAHRYLQIFPKSATGVVLDSVCPPNVCVGDKYDVAFNKVGKAFLDMCGADEFCSSKLGKEPWKLLGKLYTKLEDKGHCPNFTSKVQPAQLPMIFAVLLRTIQFRALIPALIYRLDRCNPADEVVLAKFLQLLQGGSGGLMPTTTTDTPKFGGHDSISPALNAHILMSEMWSVPAPSYEKIKADLKAAYIAPGATNATALIFNTWPKFKRDEFANKFASTEIPVLLLNGTLDPQTPDFYAQTMFDGLKAPKKQLVLIPGAAHGTVSQAPTITGTNCGMDLSVQFFADPNKKLNTVCTGLMVQVAFTLPPQLTQPYLGVSDLFENSKADSLTAPTSAQWPTEPWSPVPGLPVWR